MYVNIKTLNRITLNHNYAQGLAVCSMMYGIVYIMATIEAAKSPGRVAHGKRIAAKNLKPFNTLPESVKKEIQAKGSAAGIKARQEKKQITEIYAHWLASEHSVRIAGSKQARKLHGYEIINAVMGKIISRADKTSATMIREIRQAMEGTTLHIPGIEPDPDLLTRPADDLRAELERELARRDAITARRAQDAEELPPDAAPGQLVKVEILPPDAGRTPEPGKD